MKLLVRSLAGLLAGAVGFYGAMFGLFSVWGLEVPEWSAAALLAGAALLGTSAVTLLAKLEAEVAVALTAVMTLAGVVIGFIVGGLRDSLEWTVASGVALVLAAVVISTFVASADRSAV